MKKKNKGLSFRERNKKINVSMVRWVLVSAFELIAVIVSAYVAVFFFGNQIFAMGNSMSPQIREGDILFIDRLSYGLVNPSGGDIIAFYPNGNTKTHLYVKRVVAGPGDTVKIADGVCYVNGEIYTNKYLSISIDESGLAAEELTMGDDEYFVLSDHTTGSEDSRYENIGFVKKEYIFGKVWLRAAGITSVSPVR
ncbi:MAG: signal peptidase I [Lachnospiraceae bacterium]|nr:signal peptidase I [Lachnospiraceae bacterium]